MPSICIVILSIVSHVSSTFHGQLHLKYQWVETGVQWVFDNSFIAGLPAFYYCSQPCLCKSLLAENTAQTCVS